MGSKAATRTTITEAALTELPEDRRSATELQVTFELIRSALLQRGYPDGAATDREARRSTALLGSARRDIARGAALTVFFSVWPQQDPPAEWWSSDLAHRLQPFLSADDLHDLRQRGGF